MKRQLQSLLFKIQSYLYQAKEFECEEEDTILAKFTISELKKLEEILKRSEEKE